MCVFVCVDTCSVNRAKRTGSVGISYFNTRLEVYLRSSENLRNGEYSILCEQKGTGGVKMGNRLYFHWCVYV